MRTMVVSWLLAALVTASPSASQEPSQVVVSPSADEVKAITASARAFVQTWSVRRDGASAEAWFSSRAYEHRALLSEGCVGLISSPTPRDRVRAFLRGLATLDPLDEETARVQTETLREVSAEAASRVVNDAVREGFVLMHVARDEEVVLSSADPHTPRRDLHELLPEWFYVQLVPVYSGLIYFYWIPEGGSWRILNAGAFCM